MYICNMERRVEIICKGCGAKGEKKISEFNRNKRLNRENYCSRECAMKNANSHVDDETIITCRECDRGFVASSRHKMCPACRAIARKKKCLDCDTLVGYNNDRCVPCSGKFRSGENSHTWNGGRIDKKGYVMIHSPEHPRAKANGGYVFEHILVMEEKLGRYLEDDENVHHLYGIRDDNRIEHLELWIKPQPSGIRAEDAVDWALKIVNRYKPELLKNICMN